MKKWTGNDIGDEGARKISESLKINTTLTQLNLECNWNNATIVKMDSNKEWCFLWTGNDIGDEGANKISELLIINTAITQLDLSCNWNTIIN